MDIEAMQPGDLEQVLALQQTIVPFPLSMETAAETYRKIQSNDDCFIAVAKENGRVLGTATGICCRALTAPFLVIEDVVVLEEARGKGVGAALLRALDAFAARKKCAYSILVSSGFRTQAHAFYEKLGFTEDVRGFRKRYGGTGTA